MSERPNILLMMCDQLNAGVLGCYGGPVPTPNIDRIAKEGVVFTDAVCSTPFCSPSRMSILNGLYPHTHGIVTNVNKREYPAIPAADSEEGLHATDVTTEKLLHAAGYDTHHYGKLHLQDDDLPYYPDMFREHHEYAGQMAATFAEVRTRPTEEWMSWYGWALPVDIAPELTEAAAALGGKWSDKQFAEFILKMGRLKFPLEQVFDVLVADHTIGAIRSSAAAPFMITCSFNYPHDPNVVPSPYYDEVSPGEIALPASFGEREVRFERDWSRQVVADLGEVGAREFLRIYYASVKLVDDQVGRVLGALEEAGKLDDTIIVFTSDHGDMAGGHGMVWKSTHNFYDDVARIPLIIRCPSGSAGGQSDAAAGLVDIMPTLLELTGTQIPAHVQGRSLVPCLRADAGPDSGPQFAFCERVAPNAGRTRDLGPDVSASFMVRGRGWKYMAYADGDEYLYDLTDDPAETRNVADDPTCQGQKSELRAELEAWLERTGYPAR